MERANIFETSRFLRACQGLPVDTVPIWLMRQAGRFQPEYRALRQQYTLVDIAKRPALCTDVTCRPVEDFGLDAAILFSDIMMPMTALGIDFEIKENVGPVVANPIRDGKAVAALQMINPNEDMPYAFEAIERITARLQGTPLIGFSGGPFTLSSYLIEGGPSRDYFHTKNMMWNKPDVWATLMNHLTDAMVRYLRAQIEAGAHAVQVFDSWIGALSVFDYSQYVFPYMKRLFSELASLERPLIYFGVGTSALLPIMAQTGANIIGVDWRPSLRSVREQLGHGIALQGNLDPALLLGEWESVSGHAARILDEMRGESGFIFNLGHGVLRQTPVETVRRLVEWVHQRGGE